jgi:hypothetical protein
MLARVAAVFFLQVKEGAGGEREGEREKVGRHTAPSVEAVGYEPCVPGTNVGD